MSTRSARAARGTAFALLATLTAAAAHTLAGGGAPSPLFCVLIAALSMPAATALAGARPALWRTGVAVILSQALFHLAFATTGDVGAWQSAAVHVHGAVTLGDGPVATALVPSPVMLLGHLAAAAVTALAVHRGERLVRVIARWLPRLVRRVCVLVRAARPRRPRPVHRVFARPTSGRLAFAIARRGPPPLLSSPVL